MSKNKKYDLLYWGILLLYRILFYLSLTPYKLYYDSQDFIEFPFKIFFLTPEAVNGRVFLYPLIIRILFFVFGEKSYLTAVVILQIIVSFISIIFLKKTIELFIDNNFLVKLMVGLYAVNSTIMGWDKSILTESFALSFLIITFYFTLLYLKTSHAKFGIYSIFWAVTSIFQRPTSLLYFIIISIFFVLYQTIKKIWTKKMVFCLTISWVLLIGYCLFFQSKFGIFSVTDAIPRQQLIIVMENEYYKSSSNTEFVNMIDEQLEEKDGDLWGAMWEVLRYFGNANIQKLTTECIKLNMNDYLLNRLDLMIAYSQKDYISDYIDYKDANHTSGPSKVQFLFDQSFRIFNVGSAFIFSLLSGIFVVLLWIKRKDIPWVGLGLFTSSLGTVLVSYVGTCAEYHRTMICVVPIIYIGISWWIGGFKSLCEM